MNVNDVYKLNDQLKEEQELKDNNMTAAYSNQLYGTSGSGATVGASSSAAESDYGNYLAAQNQQLQQKPQRTSASATAATTATSTPAPAASAVDYSSLSEYDQKLSDAGKNEVLKQKQAWAAANAAGDTAGMQEAFIQAQLARAKYGGYISDVNDGSGYAAFGYGNLSLADRSLSQEDQDMILYWKLQYMNAETDADRKYAQDQANAIRAKAGYTSTDGSDYNKNKVDVNSQYEYLGDDYVDPYASEIAGLTAALNSDTGWNPASYDPSADAAYQAYADYYNRNGQAAANSALAQAAGNTGGIANSYAQALAASIQQSYAKQLTDIIPTLQANAQQSYNSNIANKQALLAQLQAMSQNAYNQYDINRNFDRENFKANWENLFNMHNLNNANEQNAIDRNWQSEQNEFDRELDRYLASLR